MKELRLLLGYSVGHSGCKNGEHGCLAMETHGLIYGGHGLVVGKLRGGEGGEGREGGREDISINTVKFIQLVTPIRNQCLWKQSEKNKNCEQKMFSKSSKCPPDPVAGCSSPHGPSTSSEACLLPSPAAATDGKKKC